MFGYSMQVECASNLQKMFVLSGVQSLPYGLSFSFGLLLPDLILVDLIL
jgi:hypothetical protein